MENEITKKQRGWRRYKAQEMTDHERHHTYKAQEMTDHERHHMYKAQEMIDYKRHHTYKAQEMTNHKRHHTYKAQEMTDHKRHHTHKAQEMTDHKRDVRSWFLLRTLRRPYTQDKCNRDRLDDVGCWHLHSSVAVSTDPSAHERRLHLSGCPHGSPGGAQLCGYTCN